MRKNRKPKGEFARGGRGCLEVYVDEETRQNVKALVEAGTYPSGSSVGVAALRDFFAGRGLSEATRVRSDGDGDPPGEPDASPLPLTPRVD